MSPLELPEIPTDLDELCEAYVDATGSYAWRLADRMLRSYPTTPLSAVKPQNAIPFLRLRATILDAIGDVKACRAIYKFAATQAAGTGEIVAQAAALAQLHVDRSLRLDGDTEHGSPYVGEIRKDLLEIASLLTDNPTATSRHPDLATSTLAHLTHGLALIGAGEDARKILDAARLICPEKESLKASVDIADAVILACTGQIDEALEFGEIILGRDSEDPLALQIQVREFLATWYRSIEKHEDALRHLQVVIDLCRDADLAYMAVVAAMEMISSLVILKKPEIVVDLSSWALDTASEIGINNEVVRTLDVVLVETLASLDRHVQAINCAELAARRASEHGDVDTALILYELGAKSARILGDQARAANLYGICAELSTGTHTIQARYLRMQATAVLSTVGLEPPLDTPETNHPWQSLEQELLCGQRAELNSIATRTAVSLASDLLHNALSLLISTPEDDRERGAEELSRWNRLKEWLSQQLPSYPSDNTKDE